jgi:integrase
MDERIGQSLPATDRGWQLYLTNSRPPGKRKWLSMGNGLVVCLEPSGKKTFQTRPRRKGEKNPRRVNIGSFPACSVIDARRRLLELNSVVAEGRDPALEQRRARAGVATLRTLNDLIREYLGRRSDGQIGDKTLRAERNLEGVLAPALGDRLNADLAPVDFGQVIGDYAAHLRREGRSDGANANKLLKASRRMFKMARGWGFDVPDRDPTAGLANPAREVPRDRILFDGGTLIAPDPRTNETGQLTCALITEPSPVPVSRSTRLALMLTLLLGLRVSETSSLEWRGILLDGDSPTVSVLRSKTKSGLRTLPLPRAAVAILTELRAQSGQGAIYVFPGADGAAAAARRTPHLHPESLSRGFVRACVRLRIDGASAHDLRRTVLSALVELGHEGVAERIAGHAPRHTFGRHYNRSSQLGAMRLALEAWSAAVDDARARFEAAQGA